MSAAFRVEHATRSSRIGSALLALALVVLAAAPLWGGRDHLRLLAEIPVEAREPREVGAAVLPKQRGEVAVAFEVLGSQGTPPWIKPCARERGAIVRAGGRRE